MNTINTISMYRNLRMHLSRTSTSLNDLYLQASSGYSVDSASDDPSSVGTIIKSRTELSSAERFIDNCRNVQDELATAETYIETMKDIFDRASEIAVAGANDTLSDTDRLTYADEVGQLREQLLDLANTRVGGKYIFAGYSDDTEPFSGDPVTYQGTGDHKMIEVSSGVTVASNVTGDELLMSPVDLFATLDDLETALQSGDGSQVSSQITALETAAQQLRSNQSLIGTRMSRLDDVLEMQESASLLLSAKLSDAQDADLTEVLSDIAKMELSMEATMEVTSRVSSLTLFDYL